MSLDTRKQPFAAPWRPLVPSLKLGHALCRLALDVERIDEVFRLNDYLLQLATADEVRDVLEDFASTPSGARALEQRRTLGKLDYDRLRELPPSSFGGSFVRFLDERGLDRDDLLRYTPASDLEYVLVHFYETHDLWHVLTGFDTDPAGELGVQAFLFAQTRSYVPILVMVAVLMNTVLKDYDDRRARMDAIAHGWTAGKASASLVGVAFDDYFEVELAEVRRHFGIPPYPGQSDEVRPC